MKYVIHGGYMVHQADSSQHCTDRVSNITIISGSEHKMTPCKNMGDKYLALICSNILDFILYESHFIHDCVTDNIRNYSFSPVYCFNNYGLLCIAKKRFVSFEKSIII